MFSHYTSLKDCDIAAGEVVVWVLGLGLIGIGMAGLIVAAVLCGRRSDRHAR